MDTALRNSLRDQLVDRRRRLEGAIDEVGTAPDLVRLLLDVDAALERFEAGTYGRCEVCGLDVDDEDLVAKPVMQYCLCKLSPQQQSALERDLELARRVQFALLPKQNLAAGGWEVHFRYLPAGPVSGDFCDAVARDGEDGLHLLMGDVSGKGVAASLLMARLNALFRSALELDLPPADLVARMNRQFSESTPAPHYATVLCARADASGAVELCNAGHCPPLLAQDGGVSAVDATGFPVGLSGDGSYDVHELKLGAGDTLLLYSDGLIEAHDADGDHYGIDRLTEALERNGARSPAALAAACLEDLAKFRDGTPTSDDLTLMVVRRSG